MSVLALDITGTPKEWISFDTAIRYHATNSVAWYLGDVVARYRGGIQNNGTQSYLETTSIIAIRGNGFNPAKHASVSLSNRALFARDRHICCFCGQHFANFKDLSRDHIIPLSQGGANNWMNVVCSCKTCNGNKGPRTPEQAGMKMLYIPYQPNHAEHLILMSRNILADQMDYLTPLLPRNSRILL